VDSAPTHVIIVAAAAFLLTAIQLWRRFHQRRIFQAVSTTALYLLICLIAAIASGALSSLDSDILGYVALAATYPFWAARPTHEPALDDQSTLANDESKVSSTVVDVIWSAIGVLTERLDTRLSTVKTIQVEAITTSITQWYESTPLGAKEKVRPLRKRVYQALESNVQNLTDEHVKQVRMAELRSVLDKSRNHDIEPLVSLAYDWRVEKMLRKVFS
jgi:hypothetical protein